MSGKKRVLVVGGGVSGLAAAHRLQELAAERDLPLTISLREASDRVGGTVSTRRDSAQPSLSWRSSSARASSRSSASFSGGRSK